MNTKNNRRRRASMQKIEKAFVELLQNRELTKITVAEICHNCGCNRSTFYANYPDIYALADKVRDNLEAEVAGLYAAEREQGFNSNDYLRLFQHIRDNQLFYKTYFKLGYDNNVLLHKYDTRQAEQFFHNKHIDYHIKFFYAGFNAVVKMWLDNGCQETPEELAEIIRSEYQGRI